MTTHQIKLEERETRKMLQAARSAKKDAARKARKQDAVRAKRGEPVEQKKRFQQKGVMVLKSELVSTTQAVAQPPSASKAAKKGGRKSVGNTAAAVAAPEGSVEPPFSFEVHFKNQQVLADVTLHKVPGHLIDVESTTSSTLVVQTPKYTKKYFLAFPIPGGMKINPDKAEYTFETGVLKCVLPIVGDVAKELRDEREKLIESFKSQRGLRFRVSKEGELVVRSRRATLANPETLPTTQSSKPDVVKPMREGKSAVAVKGKPASQESAAAAPDQAKKASTPPTKKAAVAAKAPQQSASKKKPFVADGADMLAIAKASGAEVRNQLYAKLAKARELQQKRSERLTVREVRKTDKREKEQEAFARILADQKRQLLERTAMAEPAPKKETAKTVSFA